MWGWRRVLRASLPGLDKVICGCGLGHYVALSQRSTTPTCSVIVYELSGWISNLQFNHESHGSLLPQPLPSCYFADTDFVTWYLQEQGKISNQMMRAIKVIFCHSRYLERNKYDCGGVDFNRYSSFNQKVKHLVGSVKVVFTKDSGIQVRKELLYEGKKAQIASL